LHSGRSDDFARGWGGAKSFHFYSMEYYMVDAPSILLLWKLLLATLYYHYFIMVVLHKIYLFH